MIIMTPGVMIVFVVMVCGVCVCSVDVFLCGVEWMFCGTGTLSRTSMYHYFLSP